MKNKEPQSSETLVNQIIEAIKSKKGKELVSIGLKDVGTTVCDYFVLCNGDSKTQVNAIADGIEEAVKKNLGQNAHHKEGATYANWVLLDYTDVVVHIFQKEYREFYQLETLWADGVFKHFEED